MKKITIDALRSMKASGEKIAMLTAYDATFSAVLDDQGIDVILVGDSLGMVVQGHKTTMPVSMDDMVYHTRAVSRSIQKSLLLADLPFMSFSTREKALDNAARLMQEGHAHMVKLEGGSIQAEVVDCLARRGIPVCVHLGLQPQSVHKLSGYRVQGREDEQAKQMLEDARILEQSGADLLVLECVPAEVAVNLAKSVQMPVIGIGAGVGCDGQVLVLHDLLGISSKTPRFAKNFLAESGSIQMAVSSYVNAVKSKAFPASEHSF